MNTANETGSAKCREGCMDFKRVTLRISGTMAWADEYEVVRTSSGAEAAHYSGGWMYNKLESRKSCRQASRKLSQDEYDKLAELFCSIGVPSWHGKSWNDPDVLDGYGFYMDAELADGTLIYASGTNDYPDNYGTFKAAMREAAYGQE